jgi:regulation of enolase protein 1 (concanavalin A-like superfamily)
VTADIGAVGAAGGAAYTAPTFTVIGSGADIWSSADEFRYVHQPSTGDCSITVRVASMTNTHSQAKAGIMIRESTAANARYAGVFVTPGAGVRFQRRSSTGGNTSNTSASGVAAPRWIRLTRTGNVFSAYHSANGTTWTQVGSNATISMAAGATLGMAVSSRSDGVLCTATMDSVTAAP